MARQAGIIKLKGTIGDITFYKSQDGHLARQKGGVDKDRFHNDPKFQRTRENASEFGRAGKASKTLCTAIRPILNKTQDSRLTSRLVKSMMQVIKSDSESARGERKVTSGDLQLLQGFDFAGKAKLTATVYAPYKGTIDRQAGTLEMEIAEFIPETQIVAPRGTTHIRFISAGVEVDFEKETFAMAQSSTRDIVFDQVGTGPLKLTNDIGVKDSDHPLFLLFGIEFLQEVNGQFYALNNGVYNALGLVLVNTEG